MLDLPVKLLHPDAVLPKAAKPGDAGLDLTAVSREWDDVLHAFVYDFGLAVEIPEGHVGLMFSRSSVCKTPLYLTNAVGVIDSGYRGSLKAYFREHGQADQVWENLPRVGDRVVQLVILPYPQIQPRQVAELVSSSRGESGWGSSGK